jgi:hypothetical protein
MIVAYNFGSSGVWWVMVYEQPAASISGRDGILSQGLTGPSSAANKLSTHHDKEIACQDQLMATKPESQTSRQLVVVEAQTRHRGCGNEGISFTVVKLPKFVESTAWTVFHQ